MTSLSESNDWSLAFATFNRWHRLYRFDVDGAASPKNAQLPKFWTPRMDAFKQDPAGLRVYSNHPYSKGQCDRWHAHAREAVQFNGCHLWGLHSPAHTSEGWWTRNVARAPAAPLIATDTLTLPGFANGYRRVYGNGLTIDVWFYEGRMEHVERSGASGSARFPNAFIVYGRRARMPDVAELAP